MNEEDESENNDNSSGNGSSNDNSQNRSNRTKRYYHYQLGAPALIYHGNRTDTEISPYRVPTSNLPIASAKSLYEILRDQNRVKARWNYVLDVDEVEAVDVPHDFFRTHKGGYIQYKEQWNNANASDLAREQQACRLAMMVQEDPTRLGKHRQVVQDFRTYENPYFPMKLAYPDKFAHKRFRDEREPRLKESDYAKGQEFRIHRDMTADSSYLAAFDLDALRETTDDDRQGFRKAAQTTPKRLPQGNALLVCPCPCPVCSQASTGQTIKQSWVLFHPKGHCLERLCVSNLIPPWGQMNAGSILGQKSDSRKEDAVREVFEEHPNEVDLDDTILEIRQCSVWTPENPQLVLAVRTTTHVSVVTVECKLPEKVVNTLAFSDETLCWGCYVVEEKERLDLRSVSPRLQSFRPISLTSHPRYGNPFTPSRFAFACHAMGDEPETRNVMQVCNTWNGENVSSIRHDIANLRKITFIDFSSTNPMCLWSAASSYVRPTIAASVAAKMTRQTKGSFGLGTSFYSIDLRTNSATFQWSPSAEEMTVEGVHSISGILTDWKRDNTIWVTSSSAGKTWEIDGRMPARSVTCWSLTSMCDTYKGIVVPKSGFHGETSLLVPTIDLSQKDQRWMFGDAPFVTVDTACGSSGIHLYQRPLRGPRFQTDCLEGVATPGIDFTNETSIATSSYFGLPEVEDYTYICGLASLRLPLVQYVGKDENFWNNFCEQDSSVLCNLTLTNHGDVFSNNILENSAEWVNDPSVRFDDLPVGTRAISIPNEIDGRTKNLHHCHQKPTCGMNLKLFLTNKYPLSRKATVIASPSKGKQNEIVVKSSRRKRKFDDSGEVAEIATKSRNAGVVMSTEDGCTHEMLKHEQSLKIPLKLSKQAGMPIAFYDKEDKAKDDDDDDVVSVDSSETPRVMSDLSSFAINDTLMSLDRAINKQSDTDEDDAGESN